MEAALAAVGGDKQALTAEAADVLYHLLVMLEARRRRRSPPSWRNSRSAPRQSGLAEKAARGKKLSAMDQPATPRPLAAPHLQPGGMGDSCAPTRR